jgi:hypothetical protein
MIASFPVSQPRTRASPSGSAGRFAWIGPPLWRDLHAVCRLFESVMYKLHYIYDKRNILEAYEQTLSREDLCFILFRLTP